MRRKERDGQPSFVLDGGDMMMDIIIKGQRWHIIVTCVAFDHKGAEVRCGCTCAKQAKVGKGSGKGRVTSSVDIG